MTIVQRGEGSAGIPVWQELFISMFRTNFFSVYIDSRLKIKSCTTCNRRSNFFSTCTRFFKHILNSAYTCDLLHLNIRRLRIPNTQFLRKVDLRVFIPAYIFNISTTVITILKGKFCLIFDLNIMFNSKYNVLIKTHVSFLPKIPAFVSRNKYTFESRYLNTIFFLVVVHQKKIPLHF